MIAAGKHGRRGGAVASDIGGLLGYLAQQAGADIFEFVLELKLADYGDAVLGHLGSAEALLNQDIASFGAQRYPGGLCHQCGPLYDSRPCSLV